ncbi:GlcG/HbpS family heme-binding protein [Gluconacetobacter sacchari]|uniref:Heme-binding protein n=2 Tax=Gluconacetobacter sacchari TaxID=92759 RepID=A0A7W4IFV3_9PROT|nr:heme-binding protein [Gluconacetobacter sacchari]MBB2162098.1 heme-binding protein [Gluconacetobacter sacchari]
MATNSQYRELDRSSETPARHAKGALDATEYHRKASHVLRLKSVSAKIGLRLPRRILRGPAIDPAGLPNTACTDTSPASVAISLPQARAMARAAEEKAVSIGTSIVVTVVDEGGRTILVERMADAQLASLELSERKAVSAVFYKRPSAAFEKALAGGKMAVLALPHAMPAAGGLPILHDGRLIGAIGVSGGNNAQDEEAAEAALSAIGS